MGKMSSFKPKKFQVTILSQELLSSNIAFYDSVVLQLFPCFEAKDILLFQNKNHLVEYTIIMY